MAFMCEYCAKQSDYGHNVSHAKNRTRRVRRPNLRSKRVIEAGSVVRRLLCTKCARNSVRPHDDKMAVQAE
jgi:large subunit ribosomal protein L28